jgi:secondary thiamine-phosphate synthase enzyme
MIAQKIIRLSEKSRGCHLITREIVANIGEMPELGMLNLFVQHTSCALTINENADSSVRVDMENNLNEMVPENAPYYTHIYEGDDDMPSHVKSSLFGVSLVIPITDGRLNLGTWQGIYLCEFRNYGGVRNVVATIYS